MKAVAELQVIPLGVGVSVRKQVRRAQEDNTNEWVFEYDEDRASHRELPKLSVDVFGDRQVGAQFTQPLRLQD